MEKGRLRYLWLRWPSIILMMGLGCFVALIGIKEYNGVLSLEYNGVLSFAAGCCFAGAFHNFYKGITYDQKTKFFLNEIDAAKRYKNGLLVVINGVAKLITHNVDEIEKRGYVYIIANFNRRKKILNWTIEN